MRTACLILLATALVPLRSSAAQPVAGVVVEEGTGTPILGAMVILFDSTGTKAARALSNAAGRFLVQARDPGPHYITVERIGYAGWTTDPFEPEEIGELLTIQVPVQAIPLEGLDVSGERRCEVRPEEGQATARVWDEVRKALAAEEYTREASLYRYTLLRHKRELDRNARKTIGEETTVWENMPESSFVMVGVPFEAVALVRVVPLMAGLAGYSEASWAQQGNWAPAVRCPAVRAARC